MIMSFRFQTCETKFTTERADLVKDNKVKELCALNATVILSQGDRVDSLLLTIPLYFQFYADCLPFMAKCRNQTAFDDFVKKWLLKNIKDGDPVCKPPCPEDCADDCYEDGTCPGDVTPGKINLHAIEWHHVLFTLISF